MGPHRPNWVELGPSQAEFGKTTPSSAPVWLNSAPIWLAQFCPRSDRIWSNSIQTGPSPSQNRPTSTQLQEGFFGNTASLQSLCAFKIPPLLRLCCSERRRTARPRWRGSRRPSQAPRSPPLGAAASPGRTPASRGTAPRLATRRTVTQRRPQVGEWTPDRHTPDPAKAWAALGTIWGPTPCRACRGGRSGDRQEEARSPGRGPPGSTLRDGRAGSDSDDCCHCTRAVLALRMHCTYRTGAALARHRYCTRTTLVLRKYCAAAAALWPHWHCTGAARVLRWYVMCAVLVLHWYCACTVMAPR